MSSSEPEQRAGWPFPATDLPYGPLPVHPDADVEDADRAAPPGPGEVPGDATPPEGQDVSVGARVPERASNLELADGREDADDDVHFGVAAKALGVSRKTVERMVKRGQLARGPSGAPATVSKRSLVTVLEERRRTGGHASTDLAPGPAGRPAFGGTWPQDATAELQELLRPALEPWLEEFVAAKTRAAVLENQLELIAARAAQERARDELLLALATGGWSERRKARKLALRHYVLRDDVGA